MSATLIKLGTAGLLLTLFAQLYLSTTDPTLTLTYGKDSNYRLTLQATSDDHLLLDACFPENTWFGLGLGGHLMTNAELVFFMASTNLSERKVLSTRMDEGSRSTRPQHFPEDSPLYERQISSCGVKMIRFKVKRAFIANDPIMEKLQRNAVIDMSVAGLYNEFNTTYSLMPGHTRGKGFHQTLHIRIHSDNTIEKVGGDLYQLHGYMLWSAWSLAGLLQIASLRYMKPSWRIAIWLHRLAAMCLWSVTVYMGVSVIQHENWVIKDNPHSQGGALMIGAVTFPLMGGIAVKYLQESTKLQGLMLKVKSVHKLFGYLIIVMGQFTSLMGGLAYAEISGMPKYAGIAYQVLAVFFLALFFLEVNHRVKEVKGHNDIKTDKIISDIGALMSHGRKIVILDDLVLDVTEYKWEHPGGAYLFDQLNGRDISKFYYGGYSLTADVAPVRHSVVADTCVATLVIGRLENKCREYEGRIIDRNQLNENTQAITMVFDGELSEYQHGQHILVTHEGVSRQYTIANSMRPKVYSDAIQGKVTNVRDPFEITIVVKNYNTGLSKMLNATEQTVRIRAPLGKGISTNTTIVAFAAGTGILAFMDLIAQKQHANRFILHASFASRKESIGLELLEALAKKQGSFELNLRFADESKQRWDREYVQKQFKGQGVDNVRYLVCGPPVMNELFDRILAEISTENGGKLKYEVL